MSSTTPPSPLSTILILTPVHSSLPPSTAPPAPVEALAATCGGSTARLKWGVCGVVWWAQCGLGVGTEFSTDAATSWCNQRGPAPAVSTAGANSTVTSVIVAQRLFNEDHPPLARVSLPMIEEGRPSRCSHLRNEPICHSPIACQEPRVMHGMHRLSRVALLWLGGTHLIKYLSPQSFASCNTTWLVDKECQKKT